jgi:serine/threonine-protein kinase
MATEHPRLVGGRYRLERTLGRGGMGTVYAAVDTSLERAVAVKVIQRAIAEDADLRGRFLREAKSTARLRHENVVEVFDVGETDEHEPFFVMELLEGETLAEVMRRGDALGPSRAIAIALQICSALDFAHREGVVHRDVKPANVMLVQNRGGDVVKLLDFGVAKVMGQTTLEGAVVGTVEYMAPEQISGAHLDGRCDIYALGAVLYRMLSGAPLFRADGVAAMMQRHLSTAPEPLRVRAAHLPEELERVVHRALAKRPEDRYTRMSELADALRAIPLPLDETTLKDPPGAPAEHALPLPDVPARPIPSSRDLPRELSARRRKRGRRRGSCAFEGRISREIQRGTMRSWSWPPKSRHRSLRGPPPARWSRSRRRLTCPP